MEKWILMAKRADFKAIAEKFGIDPVVARIIRNRDIIGDEAIHEYLYGGTECIRDPFLLKDMDRAVDVISGKIREGSRIRVIGDYDIDGIMSSYILRRGLAELGADVDVRIPDRMTDGYGINERLVNEAHFDGIDTIVTCDNGIAAEGPARLARSLGMTMVITDHHEVLSMPEADAVVDPKRPDDTSGYPHLCGASVAWKLVRALGGDRDLDLIQYAAFATIGDIVELTGENRVIVKEGLRRLRETDNRGLRALAEATGTDLSSLTSWHIGFVLGPCLNASGRLSSAMRGLELLESANDRAAQICAEELRELNETRKAMTKNGVMMAEEAIAEGGMEHDKVLVIFLEDVHESVAGIIAGRIREAHMRPTIILTRSMDMIKGSGRSTDAYSMFEELAKVRDILVRFGGHPMAAGLSLEEKNIDELRRRLNEACTLTEEDLVEKIRIDVPMPVSYVTEELVEQLSLLEPFGKGNEKPVFAEKHVFLEHPRIFGADHRVLKARVRSMRHGGDADPERPGFQADLVGPQYDAVYFRDADALGRRIEENPDISIVYDPEINNYMGQRRVQIVISHFQ
ncbi:MAG: single-stranded-DNA-specific exonuclease RecJ [Lachnospiraceae bacterium]|nr:single-stranded-DNA-specific exonuclease RecJ [Lachnospiraceae bacterium]